MLFFSESKLVFQVVIGGRYCIVEFSDSAANHRLSTFQSKDENVIDAIRRHKFFRQGKIWCKEEPVVVEPPKEEQPEQVLEFGSYSQLKSYLRKTFKGDPAASKLKTPAEVSKFAREKGVNYRFTED